MGISADVVAGCFVHTIKRGEFDCSSQRRSVCRFIAFASSWKYVPHEQRWEYKLAGIQHARQSALLVSGDGQVMVVPPSGGTWNDKNVRKSLVGREQQQGP